MEKPPPFFTPEPRETWWPAVVLATLLVIPLLAWVGTCARTEYQRGQDSKSWPATTGRVISSKWEDDSSCDSEGCTDSFHVHISYEYLVGGRRYEASRYRFGWPDFGDKEDVKKIVSQYPVGGRALVYYDPEDPSVSALRPGLAQGSFILALWGLGLLAVMLWFVACGGIFEGSKAMARWWRRRRSDRKQLLNAFPESADAWEGPGRLDTPAEVYRAND